MEIRSSVWDDMACAGIDDGSVADTTVVHRVLRLIIVRSLGGGMVDVQGCFLSGVLVPHDR